MGPLTSKSLTTLKMTSPIWLAKRRRKLTGLSAPSVIIPRSAASFISDSICSDLGSGFPWADGQMLELLGSQRCIDWLEWGSNQGGLRKLQTRACSPRMTSLYIVA